MASQALQNSGLFLSLLGFLFLHITTVSNEWKTSNMAILFYEGLWMHCTESLGIVQCNKFYPFLVVKIMSILLEITGFIFTLGGWVIVGATLSNSYWKVSTQYGSVITTSTLYENLWQSCAEESTGISNCRAFNTLLALPAYIQACRALMILSLILGMCGTLLTLLGLRCTQLGNRSAATKTKMAMIGGMIFILAGLSSMVAISWYAARITVQFFDSIYGGTKYELGYALYLGWAGSLLSIVGGIFLTCSCKEKHRDYKYAAAQKANEPCVYIKQSETVAAAKDYV